MRVKVCGMTRIDQVRQLDEMGIEFAGFIFYPRSPRYVRKFQLKAEVLRRDKLGINRVGVFVNEDLQEILKTVEEWRLHMVQLHGDESPKFCEQVSNHVTTIKVFRVSPGENLSWKIFPFKEACDMFLFDTVGTNFGGTGQQFDWKLLDGLQAGKPFFLSGGIGPEDAGRLLEFESRNKGLFAADINSRFEVTPGVKDLERIRRFAEELREGTDKK